MSYYAGISVYADDIMENDDGTISLIPDDTFRDDLYVQGRRDLHLEWGNLCHVPFTRYSVNDMSIDTYTVLFDQPELDGRIVKSVMTDAEGNEVSKEYSVVKSISFADFDRQARGMFLEFQDKKTKTYKESQEETDTAIKDCLNRIDKLMFYQTKVTSEEVFNLFQQQVDQQYEKLSTLRRWQKDTTDYYTSGEYEADYGYADALLEILNTAKLALSAGRIVSVYGD